MLAQLGARLAAVHSVVERTIWSQISDFRGAAVTAFARVLPRLRLRDSIDMAWSPGRLFNAE